MAREHGEREGNRVGMRPLRVHSELAADQQLHIVLLGGNMGANHARQAALVRDRQGRVPKLLRALDQFLWAACPTKKAEVAQALQLGIKGQLHFEPSSEGAMEKPGGLFPGQAHLKIHSTPACSLTATQ